MHRFQIGDCSATGRGRSQFLAASSIAMFMPISRNSGACLTIKWYLWTILDDVDANSKGFKWMDTSLSACHQIVSFLRSKAIKLCERSLKYPLLPVKCSIFLNFQGEHLAPFYLSCGIDKYIHLPRPQMRPHILQALGPHKNSPGKNKVPKSVGLGKVRIYTLAKWWSFTNLNLPEMVGGPGFPSTKHHLGWKKLVKNGGVIQHPCGEPTVRTLLSLNPPCISYIHIILWLWMSMVQNYQPSRDELENLIKFSSQILWTST